MWCSLTCKNGKQAAKAGPKARCCSLGWLASHYGSFSANMLSTVQPHSPGATLTPFLEKLLHHPRPLRLSAPVLSVGDPLLHPFPHTAAGSVRPTPMKSKDEWVRGLLNLVLLKIQIQGHISNHCAKGVRLGCKQGSVSKGKKWN